MFRSNYLGLNFHFASNRFMRRAYAYNWQRAGMNDRYHWMKVAFEDIVKQYKTGG